MSQPLHKSKPLTPEARKRFWNAVEADTSIRDLGRRFGMSDESVKVLKRKIREERQNGKR